jgi:hypothetical protein
MDAAALKRPGVELHRLLHVCEAWRCRVEEVFHFLFHSGRFLFLMQQEFQCNVKSLLLFLFSRKSARKTRSKFQKYYSGGKTYQPTYVYMFWRKREIYKMCLLENLKKGI